MKPICTGVNNYEEWADKLLTEGNRMWTCEDTALERTCQTEDQMTSGCTVSGANNNKCGDGYRCGVV